jgi:hypothetical protein
MVGFEVLDRGSGEFAGVEFGEDPVGVAECGLTLDRDRALVVEAETDESEHGMVRFRGGVSGSTCVMTMALSTIP